MIMTGGVTSFLSGLRADREATYNRMADVKDSFEEFSTEVSLFEDYRDSLYEKYLANLTYDTMGKEDATIKKELKSYEEMVDSIYGKAKTLSKLCDDVYYPESSVNNKCSNYKTIYEQVNNYFVDDIKSYNNNVKKFNDYQASVNSNISLNKYKTSKDYMDYNEDGTVEGKDE
jgi:phage pi2 protein 07